MILRGVNRVGGYYFGEASMILSRSKEEAQRGLIASLAGSEAKRVCKNACHAQILTIIPRIAAAPLSVKMWILSLKTYKDLVNPRRPMFAIFVCAQNHAPTYVTRKYHILETLLITVQACAAVPYAAHKTHNDSSFAASAFPITQDTTQDSIDDSSQPPEW